MTGLLIIPFLVIMGASFDFLNATITSTKLETSLQSAALAAVSFSNDGDPEEVTREFVLANLQDEGLILDDLDIDIQTTISQTERIVEVNATTVVNTSFLKLIGIKTIEVDAVAEATQTATNLELSLVLDVSSSMLGAKIDNLRTSSKDFVDQILTQSDRQHTSMSIIPFGGTVNVGNLFDDLVVPLGSATVIDPDSATYDIGEGVVDADFRFSFDNRCIEYENDDFGRDTIPLGSRGQVPDYWRWYNYHPWCPTDDSAVLFNSNNVTALQQRLDDMTLSDGTGMDIGAMWGLKSLSPEWRGLLGGDFSNRPQNFNNRTIKVLVIMTDGNITRQFRPDDPAAFNDTNRQLNSSIRINASGGQTVTQQGAVTDDGNDDTAIGHFIRVCDEAKANDIIVYTIGFQIASGSIAESLLQECASDTFNYFQIETLDLQVAFNSIAASVDSLRIVG